MKYGYARVSTDGQSVDTQVRQLTKAGCKKVFRETASGVQADRAELRKALAKLVEDDVLMVTPARPAGAIDAGSSQYPCHGHRPQGRVPFPW